MSIQTSRSRLRSYRYLQSRVLHSLLMRIRPRLISSGSGLSATGLPVSCDTLQALALRTVRPVGIGQIVVSLDTSGIQQC